MIGVSGLGLSGREVDIVFCIDGTKTMQFIIEEIKAEMQSFYAMYEQEAKEKELVTNRLRVRFIIFRTFGEEGVKAIEESPFYELPSQQNEMMDFVQGIEAKGNARNGANALEAIALALQSDWTTASGRKRHRPCCRQGAGRLSGDRKDPFLDPVVYTYNRTSSVADRRYQQQNDLRYSPQHTPQRL